MVIINDEEKKTCKAGTDPSERTFNESEDDLGVALADSERAGQEAAPITGPTSTGGALEGLFHAGFLAALLFPFSELSAGASVAGSSEEDAEETTLPDKLSEEETCSWRPTAEGDEGTAGTDSDSPRTIWVHGDGARVERRDCGLLWPSPPE